MRKSILGGNFSAPLDVLVVSPGASGSTELIGHISKFYTCNSSGDRDGLKHLPTPPPAGVAKKIIFLYRDFPVIKRSFKKRKLVHLQLMKLRPSGLSFASREYWNLKSLIDMQAKAFAQDSGFETLFINFSELFESAPKIADFLGGKDGFVETFPKRRGERTP